MNSFEEKIALGGVVALAAVYLYKKYFPHVASEGVEAAAVIGTQAVRAVIHPLDTFGIAPIQSGSGPAWLRTTPQDNPDDVVSNGAGGMNFNYF